MELTMDLSGRILVDLDDGEWSADGCLPAPKRDVVFAAKIAKHTANALEKLAGMSVARGQTVIDRGPSVDVFCIISLGKPLVRWRLARWVKELFLSPMHAVELALRTRTAAVEAEEQCRWQEQREPEAFLSKL